jgi:hypothetical protein
MTPIDTNQCSRIPGPDIDAVAISTDPNTKYVDQRCSVGYTPHTDPIQTRERRSTPRSDT